jgi:hypothetical protein
MLRLIGELPIVPCPAFPGGAFAVYGRALAGFDAREEV